LLKNKKIVIKEKPFALHVSDIQQYKTIPAFKIFTIVQRQFNPVFINAKNDLSLIGRVYSYRYDYFLKIPFKARGWRASFSSSGGGILADMGYHVVDMLISFFGSPTSFNGNFSYCYDDTAKENLEDSVSILLNHSEKQIQGVVFLNKHHSIKKEEFEIIGTEGTLLITQKYYKIFDRNGTLIKEFIPQPIDAKKVMFQEYLKSVQDEIFIDSHLQHHEDCLYLIEKIYPTIRSKN
ncbi:MAG: Gfo/Idh/MocA family oxidoreductase, partial [bacterium]